MDNDNKKTIFIPPMLHVKVSTVLVDETPDGVLCLKPIKMQG
jgi:hypothetical protein